VQPPWAIVRTDANHSVETGQDVLQPGTILEYEDVLKQASHLAESGLLASDIDAILNELAGTIEPVTTHYQWRPQLRDTADEMVLEAAANAQAHAIVTYNLRNFGPEAATEISALALRNCSICSMVRSWDSSMLITMSG
jgi:hypothetical protein